MIGWATAWKLARRELSARFRGLRLLLVCLFLGVGALAAIGTLTGAIESELDGRGRTILGGDIEVSVWQRALSDAENAALARLGTVSTGTRMQAMARADDDFAAPVELKAVDARWPLVGTARLKDGRTVTRLSALTELGIFELSARIKSLEASGNVIQRKTVTVVNRWGEKTRVKEYWIEA